MNIVHLAFEDHRQPGSGGGGLRTHEINRRLARSHQVTVVTTRYPGACKRMEDGIVYRPLGLNLGRVGRVVTYFLSLPFFAACQRADVVVEDFAAPISSALVPLFTRKPTVAVVQWLFAQERSRHYRLPLFVFEAAGVRLHRRFVAVSGYIAERIRDANEAAVIEVVPAGVAIPSRLPVTTTATDRVLYMGRIEWGPKGLDLLFEAFNKMANPDVRLVIAGDGPDQARLWGEARRAGVAERIEVLGRVSGDAKWALLASATVVAIPSRHESFGLVAAEATALGTPVVAFDVPPLRELLTNAGGLVVRRYDTTAFAAALQRVLIDPALREALSEQGRGQAGRFDWDRAARAHERVYETAVLAGR